MSSKYQYHSAWFDLSTELAATTINNAPSMRLDDDTWYFQSLRVL